MKIAFGALIALFLVFNASSQLLDLPRKSPKASIEERLGIVDLSISYSRPAAGGRVVWGQVIKMDGSQTWRAGANENTILSISHDVQINGKSIAAGSYGLFFIPTNKDWTLIFSYENDAWGAFNYDPGKDALRLTVTPTEGTHVERLEYRFVNHTSQSVDVEISWASKAASFTISADIPQLVLASIETQLLGSVQFDWRSWNEAANYCLDQNYDLERGLKWAELSIDGSFGSEPTLTNHLTKSKILMKLGRTEEANQAIQDGLKFGTMREVHRYARYLLTLGEAEKALKIFIKNSKDYPGEMISEVGLARGYEATGDKKKAIKYYLSAAELTNDMAARYYKGLADQLSSEE